MPKEYNIKLQDDDVQGMLRAQKLIADVIDQELPLEVLIGIYLKDLQVHTFAVHVCGTITGDKYANDALANKG